LWVEVEINILPIITFKNKGSIGIFIGIDGNFCYQNRDLTKKQRPHLRKSKQTGTALMANKRVSQRLLTLEHKLERQSDTIKNILSLTTKNPYAPNTIKTIPITLNHRLIVLSWLLSDVKHRLEYKLNRKKQRPQLRKSKQTGTALMANKKVSQRLLTLEHKLER
jgi:hypothetical protein